MKKNFYLNHMIVLAFVLVAEAFAGTQSFSISTYNIRNFAQIEGEDSVFKPLDGPTNLKAMVKVIHTAKSEIMAFQEVINGPLFERVMAEQLPKHRVLMSECGGTADQKIAIAYDESVFSLESYEEEWRISLSTRCNFGLRPALIAWLKHKKTKKRIAVIAVHLKAGSGDRNRATRKEQHQVLKTVIGEISSKNLNDIIILGDFNTTSYIEQTPGAAQFEDFLSQARLKNTSASVGCSSYWQGDRGDGKMWPSHLDHILHRGKSRLIKATAMAHCSQNSCSPVSEEQLGESFTGVSDHCPVQVEVRL